MRIQVDATEVSRKLKRIRDSVNKAPSIMSNTMNEHADRILAEAVLKAPVDTGVLRSEGRDQVQQMGSGVEATISFGGLASQYAEYQHEHDELNHPRGGQDHFLHGRDDSAWNETSRKRLEDALGQRITQEVDRS